MEHEIQKDSGGDPGGSDDGAGGERRSGGRRFVGSDAQGIGPGFSVETENGNPGAGTENGGEQPVYPMAWEKVNGVYMDAYRRSDRGSRAAGD